jgi:hypothetical protein
MGTPLDNFFERKVAARRRMLACEHVISHLLYPDREISIAGVGQMATHDAPGDNTDKIPVTPEMIRLGIEVLDHRMMDRSAMLDVDRREAVEEIFLAMYKEATRTRS